MRKIIAGSNPKANEYRDVVDVVRGTFKERLKVVISDLYSMPTEMLHEETCYIMNAYCYT